MARAENRHYRLIKKKKQHPASKCGNAKCFICHSDKVLKIPDIRTKKQNEKDENNLQVRDR